MLSDRQECVLLVGLDEMSKDIIEHRDFLRSLRGIYIFLRILDMLEPLDQVRIFVTQGSGREP